jgi:hypothetical protein
MVFPAAAAEVAPATEEEEGDGLEDLAVPVPELPERGSGGVRGDRRRGKKVTQAA